MGMRELLLPWAQPPQECASYSNDSLSAFGIVGGFVAHGGVPLPPCVDGRPPDARVSFGSFKPGVVLTEKGPVCRLESNTAYSIRTGSPSSRSFTLLARVRVRADGVFGRDSAGGTLPIWRSSGGWRMRIAGTNYSTAGAFAQEQWYDVAIVGTTSTCQLYVGDALVINGGAANSAVIGPLMDIGSDAAGGGGGALDVGYYLLSNRPLDVAARSSIRTSPEQLFEPARIWVPVGGGGGGASTKTLITSLEAAVQVAREVAASTTLAVQESRSSASSLALAVQQASSAQTQLAAAIQQVLSAASTVSTSVQITRSASLGAGIAVRAPGFATTSVVMAVQTAYGAYSGINLRVLDEAGSLIYTGIGLAVQAARDVSTALGAAVQDGRTASLGVSLAVQRARAVLAQADMAVRLARGQVTSLDLVIYAGTSRSALFDLAVRQASAAVASVSLAVARVAEAQVNMDAVIALRGTSSAEVQIAVRGLRANAALLSAFVFDAGERYSIERMLIIPREARGLIIPAEDRTLYY